MKNRFVQYGCGLSAPPEWENFDISPTLRLQKVPIIGFMIKKALNVKFPKNVRYGDIIKGLPIEDNSCDAVYCSHTLEHLSLDDIRAALRNTYKILKPGGIFRCVVPDLEYIANTYVSSLRNNDKMASIQFMKDSLLGTVSRPRGLKAIISTTFGNSNHLWMWDKISLANELEVAGFTSVKIYSYEDNTYPIFNKVQDSTRFENAVSLEGIR